MHAGTSGRVHDAPGPRMNHRSLARWAASFQALQLLLALCAVALQTPADWIEIHAPLLTLVVPSYTVTVLWWASWSLAERVLLTAGAFLLIPIGLLIGNPRFGAVRRAVALPALGVGIAISGAVQAYGLVALISG